MVHEVAHRQDRGAVHRGLSIALLAPGGAQHGFGIDDHGAVGADDDVVTVQVGRAEHGGDGEHHSELLTHQEQVRFRRRSPRLDMLHEPVVTTMNDARRGQCGTPAALVHVAEQHGERRVHVQGPSLVEHATTFGVGEDIGAVDERDDVDDR